MKRWIAICLTASLGLTMALPAAAQWKWRDRNGVQYSDLPPPPGVTEADVLQRPPGATLRNTPAVPAAAPSASAPTTAAPKAVEPELEAKKRKAEEEETAKKKAAATAEEARIAADKADTCTRAQTQLRTLESGARMSQINEKGERVFMEDPERAQETKRTKEIVAANCK